MPSANVAWGLEVGSGAIKALKLERDGDTLRVADFVVLPHKKVLSTPELNRDDAVAVALGAFMSQYRDALRGATVAVSVPDHSAFARFAKLPPVEKKGIANLVKFEAVQQIPFPIDEVEWDYQTFASDDSPEVEVGIFAMTKGKAAELLAQYGEQGLVPDVITLSPLAAYNAIAYDLSFTNQTPGTVILDIGTTATDLIIADSGKLWIRTFPLGGHNFTEAVSATFKIPYGKAEKLKREAETSKYKRHLFQAMKPVLQELVQDVQRSISYYKDTHPEAKISRVIVCGSTVKLLGLRKILSQQLQLEVYKLERFKRPQIDGAGGADFEAATPLLATAYGLALQGLGLQTINANLMPVEVVRKAVWKRKTPWFVAAAGIGLAASGIMFLRPWLDSLAVANMRADSSINAPITQTVSLGQRLKSQWTEASGAAKPGFAAANLIGLTTGRDLYPRLVTDVASMFDAAATYAAGQPSLALPTDRPPAALVSLQTQYVPPTTALTTDSGGSGGRSRRQDSGGEAPPGLTAGPSGAVRITVTFDAPTNSRAFINDSFLAWLNTSATRQGVPYTFVGIPAAADVAPVSVAPGGGTRQPPGRGQPGAGGAGAGGGAEPGFGGPDSDERDSGPSAPGAAGAPGAPGAPGAGGRSAQPAGLPPIPASILPASPTSEVYRYTLTWYAQIGEPPAPAEGDAAASASNGGRS